MTSYSLTQAMDAALDFLKMKKLCGAAEDQDAYYLTGCGENGEPIFADTCCRVDKKTLDVRLYLITDPTFMKPKTKCAIPEERKSIFVPIEEVWAFERDIR